MPVHDVCFGLLDTALHREKPPLQLVHYSVPKQLVFSDDCDSCETLAAQTDAEHTNTTKPLKCCAVCNVHNYLCRLCNFLGASFFPFSWTFLCCRYIRIVIKLKLLPFWILHLFWRHAGRVRRAAGGSRRQTQFRQTDEPSIRQNRQRPTEIRAARTWTCRERRPLRLPTWQVRVEWNIGVHNISVNFKNALFFRFEDMLRNLMPDRNPIAETMVWCIEHADAWQVKFSKCYFLLWRSAIPDFLFFFKLLKIAGNCGLHIRVPVFASNTNCQKNRQALPHLWHSTQLQCEGKQKKYFDSSHDSSNWMKFRFPTCHITARDSNKSYRRFSATST